MKKNRAYTKKNKHSNKRATQNNRKNMNGGGGAGMKIENLFLSHGEDFASMTQKLISGIENRAGMKIENLFLSQGNDFASMTQKLISGIVNREENTNCREYNKEYNKTFETYLLLDYYGFYDHTNKDSIQDRCDIAMTNIQDLAETLLYHNNPYELINKICSYGMQKI